MASSGVILGDGGHARVVHSILLWPMLGINDPVPVEGSIAIGVGDHARRREIYTAYRGRAASVVAGLYLGIKEWGPGLQFMTGAIVHPGCVIGENVLINTGAQVDHDCHIGNHCTISPGAVLCGSVELGAGCFVGAGAVIVQEVRLEPETVVQAGTLVVGPDDFRRPQRVLSPRERDVAAEAARLVTNSKTFGIGIRSNLQQD